MLQLGGVTVIERVAAAAKPLGNERFIVADDGAPYEFLGLPVVRDRRKSAGPLGGLQAALHHSKNSIVCLLACDLPFLTTEFLRYLKAQLGDHQAVIPRLDGDLQPLCAFYSTSCATSVENALSTNDFSMSALLDRVDVQFVEYRDWREYDSHGSLFANVNSPEDYDRAHDLVERFGM